MANIDSYRAILGPIITLSKLIGVELWTSEKLLQPMSYVLMGQMLIYNICTGYTVYKYRSDLIEVMKIVIIGGVATQLSFKFFIALTEKDAVRETYRLIEEQIYRRYTGGTPEEQTIIEKTVRFVRLFWKFMVVVYAATLFVFALWPLYVFYTTGQVVPLFMYEIPMTNVDEPLGYALNLLLHIDIYVLGIMGVLVSDGSMFFVVVHGVTIVDLFVLHMNELEGLLKMEENKEKHVQVAEKWKRCIQDHQLVTE